MSSVLAFPMYAVNRSETLALRQAVFALLQARGVIIHERSPAWPEGDLLSHWRQPDLILSQTCGYPLVTALPDVQVVGCFEYTAPGCEGVDYRSLLAVREEDKRLALADFRGRRAVCNSADSQSGYNALLKTIAPLAVKGRFFERVHFSGSHRQSLIYVKRGQGDIAAVDCVTWALLARHEPQLLDGLAVMGQTPLAPGLPLITSGKTSPEALAILRDALHTLASAPRYKDVCDSMLIGGFKATSRQPYSLLLDWRGEAEKQGVTGL
ncbi:TPA: PhnD/SsuA/transferrin family substrate-binding protein [Enterobacter chengduensis]|nr:PhnD/SsuA/transferrin family substrate-binding protein [Enterobacter chengduensis]